ncbi:MAG: tyrosine--tRNA ligase [Oscillospiraceae bacterium]|jgi:tyrosyl-tRNA synthetase|nr:tyrosine--tRNA ligase [Oscillospiraceae bacterium]
MTPREVYDIIRRDAVEIYGEEEFLKLLEGGRALTVKLGADPSRPDLHLGHTVPLRKMRLLQDAGHNVVFIIGDFTGMIGDPSGRSKTRVPLTYEQTRENGQSYYKQVTKILDPAKTTITYNSEWLGKLSFADVLALCGKTTLARILERDDFAKRYAANQPIGLHELLYPMMQGYDSVEIKADIEVGGTDQTFNLLMGRNLQKDSGQPPQVVLTFPLLPGLDGVEKMSKSLDNYIGVDEPPEVMFEKCMRVPDALLEDYFRLTTDVPPETFLPILQTDARAAHFAYARAIVTLYHDPQAAERGEARYNAVAGGGAPDAVSEVALPRGEYPLWKLVLDTSLAVSGSEARRLCKEGGILVNNARKTDPNEVFAGGEPLLLKRGKGKFARVVFEADF